MNENELKNLWQSANERMIENFTITQKNTNEISQLKVNNFINSMKPVKLFTFLFGTLWVGTGIIILSHIFQSSYGDINKYFLFSVTFQIGLTAVALWIYLFQLITIYYLDMSEEILKTQEKLNNLKMSTLWVTRVLFLQLPFWTTFWWNETMFAEWNAWQLLITFSITAFFSFAAVWLFINIKFENRNKKWFKLIFNGKEWTPLMKSMDLLAQVETYKTEK